MDLQMRNESQTRRLKLVALGALGAGTLGMFGCGDPMPDMQSPFVEATAC